MQEESSKYKTIAVDQETHKLIVNLAKSSDKTAIEFVAGMAKYFSKYGLDINSSPANVSKEIKLLNKNVIGFIRKHEELFLVPLSSQMEEHKGMLSKIVKIIETVPNASKAEQLSNTDVTQISTSNLKFINETFVLSIAINSKLKFIETKEKYSYRDMAIIIKSLKEKLDNASH